MNPLRTAALSAAVACSLPLNAQQTATQDARSGVSNPPAALVESQSNPPDANTIPGYQPTPTPNLLRRPTTQGAAYTSTDTPAAYVPDATATAPAGAQEDLPAHTAPASAADIDANIVTSLPHTPGELPIGTTFTARMRQTLSTASTQPGAPFSAELTEPIQQDGQVLIPAGTLLEGNVTEVRGGRRIHGTATLHLAPRTLVLPDGSRRSIRAQVIDTSQNFATRIDSEGTIIRRDHVKQTLIGVGIATGGAIAAGAVLGGGVGAIAGAGVGLGLSTAWWLKQDRQTVLPEETAVTFSLNEPIALTAR